MLIKELLKLNEANGSSKELEMMLFDPVVRKHVLYKEVKIK